MPFLCFPSAALKSPNCENLAGKTWDPKGLWETSETFENSDNTEELHTLELSLSFLWLCSDCFCV